MKRVLVITYYWPPSGGAGVQRWLKFVKYLREYGWEPVVYTPENPESPAEDLSLLKDIPDGLEVIRTRIWEPYSVYKKFVGRKKNDRIKTGFLSEKKKPSIQEKLSVWIRGNLFIPDARKYWIKPSVKHLSAYLAEHPVDAMVSTGPPHSMHLIALALKAKFNIPWIADFRDPWTNIDFYGALRLTRRSDKKHHRLEREVLSAANRVVVVSRGMAKDFDGIHARDYTVITNGFDGPVPTGSEDPADEKFTVAHIGSMVPSRNPESLWQALEELCHENPGFRSKLVIKLVGQIDHAVRTSISAHGLEQHLVLIDYLPHNEVARAQVEASVLLLIINNTPNAALVVTGKLFEYIRSGRPVLCIGPTGGDAASILSETNTGITVDHPDVKGIKMNLLSYFIRYQDGNLKAEGKGIEKYSRKNLTGQMAGILDSP
jgi:glycosyltransferase involved in cell wall biosynthesis